MSNMDLSDVVDLFGEPVALEETGAAVLGDDGRWTFPNSSSSTIIACVQPTEEREADLLPEGIRTKEKMTFYSRSVLRVASTPGGSPAQRITWQGTTYDIQAVAPWSHLGNYTVAVGTRVGQ